MSAPKRNLPSLGLAWACNVAGMIPATTSAIAANAAVMQAVCIGIADLDFRDGLLNVIGSSRYHIE
jgi:hypothetical protein